MKTKLMTAAVSLALGAGFYLLFSQSLPANRVPEEFSEARIKGAELARKIVALSEESLKNLEVIAQHDREGDIPEAVTLISREVLKNREIRQEAIKLSSQLEKMARSITSIRPASASILATEAVSSEVALVSRLISYNDYLLQLFETLNDKFQKPKAGVNGRVEELIKKINEEARAINDFNRKFNASLAEFDKIFTP